MWDLLVLVLEELQIDSQLTKETRDKVKRLREYPQEAENLLKKIKNEMSPNSCIKCENRFFCSLFLACVYYELKNFSKVQTHVKRAMRDFELSNLQWNATLANWVYGEVFMFLGREMPGRRELSKTIKILNAMGEEFRWEEKYEARDQCTIFVSKIEKRLKNMDKNWDGSAYYEKKRDTLSFSGASPSRKPPPQTHRNRSIDR